MKKLLLSFIIFVSLVQAIYAQTVIETKITNQSGISVSINITDGNAWFQDYKGMKRGPQIAIWVEDTRGNFLETLFITKFYGQQSIPDYPNTLDVVYFRGSLPLWLGRQYTRTERYPTMSNPVPDSLSSATPDGELTINSKVDKNIREGYVYIEVNNAGDYNISHTDIMYGQPSVIYRALVDFTKKDKEYNFEIVGSTSKEIEGIYYNHLKGITSAKSIIRSATITVK